MFLHILLQFELDRTAVLMVDPTMIAKQKQHNKKIEGS